MCFSLAGRRRVREPAPGAGAAAWAEPRGGRSSSRFFDLAFCHGNHLHTVTLRLPLDWKVKPTAPRRWLPHPPTRSVVHCPHRDVYSGLLLVVPVPALARGRRGPAGTGDGQIRRHAPGVRQPHGRGPETAGCATTPARARPMCSGDSGDGTSVLHEALAYLGITAGPHWYKRVGASATMTRQEQRQLAS